VFVVVGLSRLSTTVLRRQIVFFIGACCWHHASNVGWLNAGVGLSGMGRVWDSVGDLDRVSTALWEDGGRGMWLVWWDKLGSAGMAVWSINVKLLSSIAFSTGGFVSG